jgi:release factor glutamine methyltransferase
MMRLHLPDFPGFAPQDALCIPAGCRPDVEACLASGTLLLEQAGIETARLDAECLVASVLGCTRWQLLLERRRRLSREEFCRVLRLIRRRERREPLAYILKVREFWSLPLSVSPGVLVPRPETETLVEATLAAWKEMGAEQRVPSAARQTPGPAIVELCTGSGAVAIALASELPAARIVATDISWRALRVARANAERHGVAGRIDFLRGDLWHAVNGQAAPGAVDLVVANPPYIPTAELATLMPEVQWEPRRALDGGEDGLRAIREIVATSPDRIRPGGYLLLEIGAAQAETVQALTAETGGFERIGLRRDLAGRPRVVAARRPQM